MGDKNRRTGQWIGSILFAIIFTLIVAFFCGCGITINNINSIGDGLDDPGAGLVFWFMFCPITFIMIPASIIIGSIIGFFSFRFSNYHWGKYLIFSMVGGFIGVVILTLLVNRFWEQLINAFFSIFLGDFMP
jgi:hypothetical protein